jgi:transposase
MAPTLFVRLSERKACSSVTNSKAERLRALPKQRSLYAKRYLVELFFHALKRFRTVATRYDKTSQSFLSFIHICSALLCFG